MLIFSGWISGGMGWGGLEIPPPQGLGRKEALSAGLAIWAHFRDGGWVEVFEWVGS